MNPVVLILHEMLVRGIISTLVRTSFMWPVISFLLIRRCRCWLFILSMYEIPSLGSLLFKYFIKISLAFYLGFSVELDGSMLLS